MKLSPCWHCSDWTRANNCSGRRSRSIPTMRRRGTTSAWRSTAATKPKRRWPASSTCVKLDPQRRRFAITFEGLCYQELKQFDQATAILEQALKVDPLHASSEFVLARTLQRTGHTPEARQHFQRFQHLTSTKISSAIGQGYGEQGRYSTVTAVEEPQTINATMIPVHLRVRPFPVTSGGTPTGGACMVDVTGTGQMDLVLMQEGAQAIGVLHRQSDGSFAELDAAGAGLKASGHAVACTVGDIDSDGLNDLAVAMDDGVLIFRNLGHGKFSNVTAQSGLLVAQSSQRDYVC